MVLLLYMIMFYQVVYLGYSVGTRQPLNPSKYVLGISVCCVLFMIIHFLLRWG